MRKRSFYDTHSRRRYSPYRDFRDETRRSGSGRFEEPDRLRVVSPVRRTDHEDGRSDHRRRSKNVDFAPYTDGAASSKFQWDNLLEAKQLENATSSSSGFVYRFSGSGPVGPTGPSRSYGGFVLQQKENGGVHLPPRHCEHQQVGYELSVSQPYTSALTLSPPPSLFGGQLGLLRSVGIRTDGDFEHVHVQIPKPNSVEVSDNNTHCSIMNRVLQRRERSDGVPCYNNGGFMSSVFQRPSIVDSIVEKIDGALGNIDSLRKGTTWKEEVKDDEQHFVEPLCCSKHVVPEYGTEDGYRESEEGWSLRAYEKNAYTYSDYQGNCKVLPVLDHDQYVYKHGGVLDDKLMKTEVEMFDLGYGHGGKTFENQIWNAFHAASPHCHKRPQKSSYSIEPEERTPRKKEIIIQKSVKKRLRDTSGRIIHLPSSLGSCHRNVHARLGPRVLAEEEPCEAVKRIKKKELKRNLCELSRSVPGSNSSESEVKETSKHSKRSKSEPPEDSKEFKQLVQNAFFKFVKLLNENPSQRRKYIDRGGLDTLRCTLCGSKSKEFANTHSLAMHAFNSTKARHRSEHLGFHKALCVLLGWRDTPASDGLWVWQALPASEASNLKNDLIIWPPVVLIHNSSVANSNPDKRVIISIEGLEAILKGMGFGGGKTKVSRGKPANYSILVVTFNATFSGLQEAERLNKFYSDKRHGREEFQQIDDEGTQGIHSTNLHKENVLYGYLGNAEDLDKLDFESKKHSVVKSKKDIQAIVDDTLKAW
ncbi:hypothetical protein HN51_043051 [Arachis hypogaea]|uniref:uncharacterized protein LOC110265620 n=1 Tax=Arachis ipaensis TaxID=130454 RepID=UPI000A2B6963|nr:uncharacterized protein LOC110265620 [Arachis ipaensis]XP_025669329.1 uncharacterized protein LOC112769130 isoform X2 [Arachis hypogaea]QHN95170.1 uncharacterized protein DS421_18g607240 [Arachis hypogaea]